MNLSLKVALAGLDFTVFQAIAMVAIKILKISYKIMYIKNY